MPIRIELRELESVLAAAVAISDAAAASALTKVFLAEAMVSDDASAKSKAVAMLRDVIAAPDNPRFRVEEARATDDARALLRKWAE